MLWHALVKRKVLVFSLLFLLVTLPIVYLVIKYRSPVQAAWMDDAWSYRKAIAIPSHTSLETNVYVTVPTFDATDTSKFQADCGDLRFTKQNGEQLPYFVIDCDATANIHIQFDSLPAGASTYYMYYGNQSVANGFSSADFATAATGLGTQTLSNEEKSPGPVAYWKFDEGYGATANNSTSTTGINGTITGATWKTNDQCISDKCLYFTGTNNVSIPDASTNPLDFGTGDFTISTWIKTGTSASNKNLIRKGAGAGLSGWRFGILNGVPDVLIGDTSTFTEGTLGSTSIADNKWHQLLVVFNRGSNAVGYVDGIQVGTLAISTVNLTVNNASAVTVGNTFATFTGFLDDIKIYPYARTAAQIKSDYRARGTSKGTSVSLGQNAKNSDALSNGLVGYWKQDEASWTQDCSTTSVLDSSGNGLSGKSCESTTGPAGGAVGKFGNSGDFDGSDDNVTVADNTLLQAGATWTTAAWFKLDTTGSDKRIIDKTNDGTGYALAINSTTPQFITGNGSTYDTLSGTTTIATGTWYHIVGTVENGVKKIYINGKLENTASITFSGVGTGIAFRIGTRNATTQSADGKIDEVRVYNRALSGTEVAKLYTFAPGPVGYWNMEEGTGGTANDSSGNGLNGVITNAAWNQGKFGKSLKFTNSGDKVVVTHNSLLDFSSSSFTVSAWVKNTVSQWSDYAGIVAKETNWGPYTGWWLGVHNNGTLSFQIDDDTNQNSTTIASANLNDGNWHFLTAVVDRTANTITLYKDSTRSTPTTITAGDIDAGDNLEFGEFTGSSTRRTTGNIDDVRIYNYARTSGQIIEDMNAGHPLGGSPVGSQVGYWKFDEGYGDTANNSGNGGSAINGTLSIGATGYQTTVAQARLNGVNGKFNKGINFDGVDDRLDISYNSALNLPGDHTLSFWINNKKATGTTDPKLLLYHEVYLTSGFRVWITNNNYFQFTTNQSGGTVSVTSNTQLQQNQWYHLVVTYSGTTATLYINGKYDKSGTGTYVPSTANYYLSGMGDARYYLDAMVDEVKIYNAALTADEIKLDYNRGSAMVLGDSIENRDRVTSGQTLYLDATDKRSYPGSGTVWNDLSGNNYNATLSSPTWNGLKFTNTAATLTNLGSSVYPNIATNTTILWVYPEVGGGSVWQVTDMDAHTYMSYLGTAYINTWETGTYAQRTTWAIAAGVPHQIVITKNGSVRTVYDNLVQKGQVTITNIATSVNTNLIYGATAQPMGLSIVETYNRVLSTDEITQDYYAHAYKFNINAGPVGEWNFEEKTGITTNDTSGNGNVGTLTNGPTWSSGKIGTGINFAGDNDFISTGITTHPSSFTVEAWAKTDVTDGTYDTIISKFEATPYDGFFLRHSNGTMTAAVYNAGTGYSSTTTITAGVWNHWSMTFNGTTITLYKDGVQVDSDAGTMSSASQALVIGGNYTGTSEPFDGKIDNVKYFNYARTPAQIAYDYNRGGPVGWWKMDECQGIAANDSSGNGNNGNITIGATGTNTTAGTCTGSAGEAWKDGAIGKYNSSLEFDGTDDYVSKTDGTGSMLDLTSGVTMSTWIKPTTMPQVSNVGIAGKGNNYFMLFPDGQQIRAYFWNGSAHQSIATTNANIIAGTWNNVVMIYTPGNFKIYVNGVEKASSTSISDSMAVDNAAFVIASDRLIASRYFNGQIDDVRIYNYALTAQQVKTVYNSGAAVQFAPSTGSP